MRRKKVYDPILRGLHGIIGIMFMALAASGLWGNTVELGASKAAIWDLHIAAGYVFGVALCGRLIWGVIGPTEARLNQLWHWETWTRFLTTRKREPTPELGHDPYASLIHLSFYGMASTLALSGLVLAAVEHASGPLAGALFDELAISAALGFVHEFAAYVAMVFPPVHIGALILHENKTGLPIIQAMFSGYKYRRAKTEESK